MLLYIVWNILTPVFLVVAAGVVGQRWLRMDVRTLSTAAFMSSRPAWFLLPCRTPSSTYGG